VYKTGFATTQQAYESSLYPLFNGLDRLEEHLGQPGHSPYLFGANITEADIRLYPTLIRFDVAYHSIFKCNLKMIRHDYPRLDKWLRMLYWDESDRMNGLRSKRPPFLSLLEISPSFWFRTSADKCIVVQNCLHKSCGNGEGRPLDHCERSAARHPATCSLRAVRLDE
jgi:Glutathione S-transferase, C-terminal domain